MKRFSAILMIMVSAVSAAQTFDDGWEAYEAARFQDALSIFQPLANAGDAAAQFSLGRMHETGRGVPLDRREAFRWYRLAADGGHRLAQFIVGLRYDRGDDVERDPAQAARWYRLAAEQGYANAQLNLGTLYATGEGLPESPVQAYFWWDLAARAGNELAEKNREILVENLTASQIEEAKSLVRAHLSR